MRGNTWTIVALGTGLVMLPLIVTDDIATDATGSTVLELVTALGPVVGIMFLVACVAAVIALFGSEGF